MAWPRKNPIKSTHSFWDVVSGDNLVISWLASVWGVMDWPPWKSLCICFECLLCHLPSVRVLKDVREWQCVQDPQYPVCRAGNESIVILFSWNLCWNTWILMAVSAGCTPTAWVAIWTCLPLSIPWGQGSSNPTEPSSRLRMLIGVVPLIWLNVGKKKDQNSRDSEQRTMSTWIWAASDIRMSHSSALEFNRKAAVQFTVSIRIWCLEGISEGTGRRNCFFCKMGIWTAEEEKEWDFTGSLAEEKGEKRTRAGGRSRWIPAGKCFTLCHQNQRHWWQRVVGRVGASDKVH